MYGPFQRRYILFFEGLMVYVMFYLMKKGDCRQFNLGGTAGKSMKNFEKDFLPVHLLLYRINVTEI